MLSALLNKTYFCFVFYFFSLSWRQFLYCCGGFLLRWLLLYFVFVVVFGGLYCLFVVLFVELTDIRPTTHHPRLVLSECLASSLLLA